LGGGFAYDFACSCCGRPPGQPGAAQKLRSEFLEFGPQAAYTETMNTTVPPRVDDSASLTALLAAVAAEAAPLLEAHRTGRIVINFSGGDKVRIETARFRDISVGPPAK
jgi:hypothetical protein